MLEPTCDPYMVYLYLHIHILFELLCGNCRFLHSHVIIIRMCLPSCKMLMLQFCLRHALAIVHVHVDARRWDARVD